MSPIPIVHKSGNLEIISKLMNSVARKCGCNVTYCPTSATLRFDGDRTLQRHVVEETLAFFKAV